MHRRTGVLETPRADARCAVQVPGAQAAARAAFWPAAAAAGSPVRRACLHPSARPAGDTPREQMLVDGTRSSSNDPASPPCARRRGRASHRAATLPPGNTLPQPLADAPPLRTLSAPRSPRHATSAAAPTARWPAAHGFSAPEVWRLPNARRDAAGGSRGGPPTQCGEGGVATTAGSRALTSTARRVQPGVRAPDRVAEGEKTSSRSSPQM